MAYAKFGQVDLDCVTAIVLTAEFSSHCNLSLSKLIHCMDFITTIHTLTSFKSQQLVILILGSLGLQYFSSLKSYVHQVF